MAVHEVRADTLAAEVTDVSPGPVGFLATFLIVVVTVVLIVDMVRRIRRVRYTEEIRARLESEARDASSLQLSDAKDRMHDNEQYRGPVAQKRDDRE